MDFSNEQQSNKVCVCVCLCVSKYPGKKDIQNTAIANSYYPVA